MSNNQLLVSIIVPAYNSEKYISSCINSISKQSYKNIELLLINDGSTDNTEDIALKFQKKDKRIRYYKQVNSGASIARLNGIKHSSGDYLMFIDSDDYIEQNAVSELVKLIKKTNADIIKFQFINKKINNIKTSSLKRIREKLLTTNDFNNIATEIISRKTINTDDEIFKIRSSYAEDLLMNLSFFDRAKKIVITNKAYYYYRQHESSATKTTSKKLLFQYMNEAVFPLKYMINYAKKWNLDTKQNIDIIQYRAISGILKKAERILEKNKPDKKTIEQLNINLNKSLSIVNPTKPIILIKQNINNPLKKVIAICIYKRHFSLAYHLIIIKSYLKKPCSLLKKLKTYAIPQL